MTNDYRNVRKKSWLRNAYDLAGLQPGTLPAIPVFLSIVYIAWLVTTPYYRFPILTEIRFERILVLSIWVVLFLQGRIRNPFDKYGTLIILFLGAMYMSDAFSSYAEYRTVRQWGVTYWKVALLFFTIRFSVRSLTDLKWLISGSWLVFLIYQAYSLLDFASGGSYVYQQGISRAIGTWSERSVGAANAFGFLGTFSTAFSIHMLSISKNRRQSLICILCVAIGAAAAVLSGTRAAFVVILALFVFAYRKTLFRPIVISSTLVVVVLGFSLLPTDLQERYLTMTQTNSEQVSINRTAARSARSRIEGFRDGFRLFTKRPILGYGPGSSEIARMEVTTFATRPIQLHNMYGQLISELGVIGTLCFGALLMNCIGLAGSRNVRARNPHDLERFDSHTKLLGYVVFVLFTYGAFAHNLYSFYWIFAFSLASLINEIYLKKPIAKVNGVYGK